MSELLLLLCLCWRGFLTCRWPDPELLLEDEEQSTRPPSDEDDRESVEIDELEGEINGLLSPLLASLAARGMPAGGSGWISICCSFSLSSFPALTYSLRLENTVETLTTLVLGLLLSPPLKLGPGPAAWPWLFDKAGPFSCRGGICSEAGAGGSWAGVFGVGYFLIDVVPENKQKKFDYSVAQSRSHEVLSKRNNSTRIVLKARQIRTANPDTKLDEKRINLKKIFKRTSTSQTRIWI